MRKAVMSLIILTLTLGAVDRIDDDAGAKYVTVNPIAPFTYIQSYGTKLILPIVSNMEYGISVHSTYLVTPSQALDVRMIVGSQNQMNFTPQVHAGYNFFILDQFNKTNKGLYFGGDLRFWDSYNTSTGVHYASLAPSVRLGYWLEIAKRIVVDVRVNQVFAYYSWTSKENVEPAFEFALSPINGIPVLPLLSLNVGWKFM
ncbi:hypothetical protein JXM67_10335 [candidate division WOR-3 bacterium]|nr:hypothetical protein [candidate division WOR-3 bacterium]